MINVCKITAISQTVCILPLVPAHFLQLLRDGACESLLKTTRPNFKHFLPTLPHFSDPQYLRLSTAGRRGSEPYGKSLFTESSILDLLRRSRSIFGVVGETYRSIINDDDGFVKRNGNIFPHPAPLWSWFVMLVARRPLVCAGTLSENARRAQPEAHRPTRRGGGCMPLYVNKIIKLLA